MSVSLYYIFFTTDGGTAALFAAFSEKTETRIQGIKKKREIGERGGEGGLTHTGRKYRKCPSGKTSSVVIVNPELIYCLGGHEGKALIVRACVHYRQTCSHSCV